MATPPDILNLPEFRVLEVDDTGPDYRIMVEPISPPRATCIHCGTTALVRYGHHEQLIHDLPIHGRRVGITINTRRYRCKHCCKTFYEPLPAVDEKRRMTTRLVKWLGEHSARQTFAHLAAETGVSNMTVRAVFDDYSAKLGAALRIETPEFMSIVDICLIRRLRTVFTNTKGCLVIEMLANSEKKSVVRYLSGLPDHQRIRCVTMVMWRPYRDAVREVLPDAGIVVDKCHVVKMADAALDQVRKSVGMAMLPRQRHVLMKDRNLLTMRPTDLTMESTLLLSGWLRNAPALEAAYSAKESFYRIYAAASKEEAQSLQEQWERSLTGETKAAYQPLITAFHTWQEDILAYFDWRPPNACAVPANNLIHVADCMGRGYSFDVLRSRILLTNHAGHQKKLPVQLQRDDALLVFNHGALPSTQDETCQVSEGVDISALLRLAKDGLL